MKTLTGKRVIVTGAGRGLGRAYARAIGAAGGQVLVNDVDEEEAAAVCAEILSGGGEAAISAHSVSDSAETEAMVDLCISRFGGLDCLINNAGLFYTARPDEEDLERASRLIQVNVIGVLNCGIAAIRKMSPQGQGTIINIVSGAALGIPGMSTYGASKGAIISLTSGWALDLAESGIQVVAVSPVADTRLTPRSDATVAPSSDPAEIAPLIIYLLSGGAVGLSGAVVRLAYGEVSLLEHARFGPALDSRPNWHVSDINEVLGRTPHHG